MFTLWQVPPATAKGSSGVQAQMSDASTTDDDEVEEMDLPSWVREAASRCPGLVSEASLAKRKREQEEADHAFAQQLQRDEEVAAAESERRAAAESERRATATRMARENRAEPEIVFLSDSESESPPPPPRARPNPSRLQVARSPLSPFNSSPRQPVPPKRRQGRQGQSVAQTALEGQPRDHQVAGGLAPPPASLRVASLYPYQAAGFTWMLQREGVGVGADATDKRVLGGLLADEQGMGKTIQALSLCLAHPPPLHAAPIGGSLSCAGGGTRAALGTLIVCPLSLLRQWQREIGSKAAPPYGANGAQPCLSHPSATRHASTTPQPPLSQLRASLPNRCGRARVSSRCPASPSTHVCPSAPWQSACTTAAHARAPQRSWRRLTSCSPPTR